MSKVIMIHIPKCAGITFNLMIGLDNPNYFGNKFGHHYASHIKNILGEEYDEYTSFGIIRNPWDKLWSSYNFMKNGSEFIGPTNKNVNDFESYLNRIYKDKKYLANNSKINGDDLYFHKQSNWLFDKDGDKIVDIIGKFENLSGLANELPIEGLSEKLKNTHSNKTNKINYKEAYNQNMIDIVTEMYNDDIILGGYEY